MVISLVGWTDGVDAGVLGTRDALDTWDDRAFRLSRRYAVGRRRAGTSGQGDATLRIALKA
jgi:hypothetical protein